MRIQSDITAQALKQSYRPLCYVEKQNPLLFIKHYEKGIPLIIKGDTLHYCDAGYLRFKNSGNGLLIYTGHLSFSTYSEIDWSK